MRDRADNCVVVCSIENFDPMGVHTGDSITVAPAQTLSDVEYQAMRDDAFACIRRVGVETGGSNIQFAVEPDDGRRARDRDEPARVALVGAGLQGHRFSHRQDRRAPGGGLHARRDHQRHHRRHAGELRADHRLRRHQDPPLGLREAPRRRPTRLGTRMQSVGEVMAIGRTFPESLQKAHPLARAGTRSGSTRDPAEAAYELLDDDELRGQGVRRPPPSASSSSKRRCVAASVADDLAAATGVDPWFLDQLALITAGRARLEALARRRVRPAPRSTAAPVRGASSASGSPTPRSPIVLSQSGPARRPRPRCAPPASTPACGPRSRPWTRAAAEFEAAHAVPLRHLRGRGRGRARARKPRVVILGSGPEPHRPGHRVRLLLRARQHGAARRRLRDGDGQLQPRDGVDRLRHLRPPVLRAAHAPRTWPTCSTPSWRPASAERRRWWA